MTTVSVKDLALDYSIRKRISLAKKSNEAPATQGRIYERESGIQYVSALQKVSFDLSSGDRLALVGPNGAGKTTLLKVLYGIYEPTRGSVEIDGRVDALFNIGLGFRINATGRRNIVLRGLINGWSKNEIEAKMDNIINFSELGEFIDMPLDSYSAGMSARLAFSIATALEPEILLMDEWIGAGDRSFQEKARDRMNRLAASAGIVILASHNQKLLKLTCNKVLELNTGKVGYFGDAAPYFTDRGE